MKTYTGRRIGHAAKIDVDGRPLNPPLSWDQSPGCFDWGYDDSGSAQLALAILTDHLADHEKALVLYHAFQRIVLAQLPYREWELTSEQIDAWLEIIKSRSSTEDSRL